MSKELVGLGISVNVSICAAAGKRDGDHKENNGWRARDRKVYYTWQEVGMEGMSHTLEAMERNGIQICYQPTKAGEVESITFTVDGLGRYWNTGDSSISPVERCICGYFGVYPESLSAAQELPSGSWPGQSDEPAYSFAVSDPEEIAELMPLIQYGSGRRRKGVFMTDFVTDVSILDNSGAEWSVCLLRGAMPEKYIQRFLEKAGAF